MHKIIVNTATHSYPIFIGDNLISRIPELLKPYLSNKVAIITNDIVAPIYLNSVQTSLDKLDIQYFSIILPDGECYKNWETLNLIFDGLLKNHAERKTTLIALGGGVIGDMVGFAAATYQRGCPFIQIPTTLLSQVDSSVGGKTAINHPLGKNMIGAFYQPKAVLTDISTLKTLPLRELSAGLAEVIKYGILGDIQFFQWLEENIEGLIERSNSLLSYAIYHSCQMKAKIVNQDEIEQGIRAWLNLGHTFGHAIEAEMGYGNWLHGEAVAAGMILACRLSEQLGYINTLDSQRVASILQKAHLPIIPPKITFNNWLEHMQHDKKVSNGAMHFIGLNQLGEANITKVTDSSILYKVLEPYL